MSQKSFSYLVAACIKATKGTESLEMSSVSGEGGIWGVGEGCTPSVPHEAQRSRHISNVKTHL